MTKKLEKHFNGERNLRRKVALANLEKTLVELQKLPDGELIKGNSRKGRWSTTKEYEITRVKNEMKILKSRIQ